jgi:hypothetical protein
VQFALQFCDVLDAKMKDGGSQGSVGAAIAEHFDEVSR